MNAYGIFFPGQNTVDILVFMLHTFVFYEERMDKLQVKYSQQGMKTSFWESDKDWRYWL